MEFQSFSIIIIILIIIIMGSWAHGPTNSYIFLWKNNAYSHLLLLLLLIIIIIIIIMGSWAHGPTNSNAFPPHTGVYPRLKICDPAFGISTPGPMNSYYFL